MQASFAILAIGDELLDGRLRDGNAHFLCGRASELGLECKQVVCCGDDEEQIVETLNYLSKIVPLIIISGGLGPTTDDKTREAVAKFCGDKLVLDEEVLAGLKERYASRGRSFDKSNEKQAVFPSEASVLENPFGTAPAFKACKDQCTLIALPGVPSELQQLWDLHCVKLIGQQFALKSSASVYYCVFGYPESRLNTIITELELPSSIVVSYRASFPFIQLVFKADRQGVLDSELPRVIEAIGEDFIVSKDPNETLVSNLVATLNEGNYKLGLAESCTGGLVGSEVTRLSGVSSVFNGGVISYSNEIKSKLLGVSEDTLSSQGAVSHETALEMVLGAKKNLGVDCAVSITGIAGPEGGSEEKPVGMFFVGCATPDKTQSYEFYFKADREKIQGFAAMAALDCLRRQLEDLAVPIAKSVQGL